MSHLTPYFDNITDEINIIGLYLSIVDILNLCCVNVKIHCDLCDNEDFWRSKFNVDFNTVTDQSSIITKHSWKTLCLNSFNIWVIGQNPYLGTSDGWAQELTQIPGLVAVEIKSSGCNTFVVDINNNIYVWGDNHYKQLGLGHTIDRKFPTLLPNVKAKSVSTCGYYASFVIDLEDNLWGFGHPNSLGIYSNEITELHIKDISKEVIPHAQLIVPFKVKEVSCGWDFVVIKDFNDNIWGLGSGHHGQLGDTKGQCLEPFRLTDIKVKQLSTGRYHTFIIDYEDNVWAFGVNSDGRLGLGHIKNSPKITQIKSIKAKKVICGETSSAIITFENELFICGLNNNGQLGLGDTMNRLVPTKVPNIRVKNVSLGDTHSILLDTNGNVWKCGIDHLNYPIRKDLMLTPILQANIKARDILVASFSSMIIGVKYNNK